MSGYFVFSALLFIAFCSCKSKDNSRGLNTHNFIIDIQPYDGVTVDQTQYVFAEQKKIYPFVEIKRSILIPRSAYYPSRRRYRADSLINILGNQAIADHKIIGVTNLDISTTKNGIVDWGVMGLGFCPGKACIVSTFRLSKNKTSEQLFKVAIHEMGHTFGLPHCGMKCCFMRDAEGGNPTNEEKEFCTKCRSFLNRQGWIPK
jgi:archaemetzincin